MLNVVILNYNGREFLKRSIESVQTQTIKPDNFVVIDNSSTDNSWRIAKDMGVEVCPANNEHQFITGLNAAFSLFSFGHTLFMSNDIFLEEECLADLLSSPYDITWPHCYDENTGFELERGKKTIMTAAFMMKVTTFQKIGPFDTKLAPAYMEDWDYSIRARKLGFTLGQSKMGTATHLVSGTFSKAYKKSEISEFCKDHRIYVIKKHYRGIKREVMLAFTRAIQFLHRKLIALNSRIMVGSSI